MRTKIFFLFAMLASVAASAQVTNVEPVGANYIDKTVSFRVWWNAGSRDATHLSKVWVWVDYIKLNADNTTSGNTWTRAAVSTASPAASVSYDGSNRQGFWLQGNSGSYSATVTVQLNIIETKFNWCAYVSDYPPNVTVANSTYTFKGTPPFTLIASNGTTSQIVNEKTLAASALTITPTTIRDKTECPGVFCPYQGSDLNIDATHLCQQRTTGAQNWEAWIKDARDNELYRIVLMPDNKWWLAQNVKLASYGGSTVGVTCSGCTKDECGRKYTPVETIAPWGGTSGSGANKQGVCPPGWVLPLRSDMINFFNAIRPTLSWNTYGGGDANGYYAIDQTLIHLLAKLNTRCGQGNDYYGWATIKPCWEVREGLEGWVLGQSEYDVNSFILNNLAGTNTDCGYITVKGQSNITWQSFVRCFR